MRYRFLGTFLLGCALGAAVMLLLFPSGEELGRAIEPGVREVGPPIERDARAELPPAARGIVVGSRVPVEIPEFVEPEDPPSGDRMVDALRTGPSVLIPTEAELEARFGQLSAAELGGVERGISWVLHLDCRQVLEDKFDLGLYRVDVVPIGTPVKEKSLHADGTPRPTSTRWLAGEDGFMECHTAEVHQDEVPSMRARLAELAWLRKRLGPIEKQAGG